jgi:sigma-B regulation protein RsbQ
MENTSARVRNNVRISGSGDKGMLFAHGFGCDQSMWRYVSPAFEQHYRTILFDHVGAGHSDPSAYDPERYSSLDAYADDVVKIGRELGLENSVFVGHSVSAMIGVLASLKAPGMFFELVLVGPSARYIDDGDYRGGFTEQDIEELLESLSGDHTGWSAAMAPAIMANPDRPELGGELTASFCRTDPLAARTFARATFTSDNRDDLPKVTARTLVLQCSDDIIAAENVGQYVHANIPGSVYKLLDARGHCPNLSAPGEVIAAISDFLNER